MALKSGLGDLRSMLGNRNDSLYDHLTELMQALEEASASRSPLIAHSKTDAAVRMETGNGAKRKLKRRRSLRNMLETTTTEKSLKVYKSSPGCLSDSSCGDPSFFRSCTTPEPVTVDPGSETEGTVRRMSRPANASRPVPPIFPVESDSFPETMTPGIRHQRRKRLVKRMVVDDDSSAGVNKYLSPWPTMSSSRLPPPRRKRLAMESESSMDWDLESGLSSSGSEGYASSEDGRQGDDEQSDWFLETPSSWGWGRSGKEDECMGVPEIRAALMKRRNAASGEMFLFGDRMGGPEGAMDDESTPPHPPPESSDTDVSQSSASLLTPLHPRTFCAPKRWLSKPGTPAAGAINRRILQFLQNKSQEQYFISQLRKGEKRELLRLASFYRLDVRCERRRRRICLLLTKTSYSRIPASLHELDPLCRL